MREYRDRRRDPEARIAVQLSRELTRLAESFPRFKLILNSTNYRVLLQVRSTEAKARMVLNCLRTNKAQSILQIADATKLDSHSVRAALAALKPTGHILECNRVGRPFTSAQPARIFYRRACE